MRQALLAGANRQRGAASAFDNVDPVLIEIVGVRRLLDRYLRLLLATCGVPPEMFQMILWEIVSR